MYSVAIIGCGSIGSSKDDRYDSPTTDAILTHAHAFHNHPDTELIWVMDNSIASTHNASAKWNCNGFVSWHGVAKLADIYIVATPTETHHEVLMDVLKRKPKLVVAEKPFCSNIKEARSVADAYKQAGIPLMVDYIRRFDDMHSDVLNGLRDGQYGEIYHARCLYGRGLRHDGCHGLDLFLWALGECRGVSFHHGGIVDRSADDPSYTVRLEFDRCKEAYMVGTDSRAWGAFEMEFVTEKGVLRFPNWGKEIRHYEPEQEQTFGQYKSLGTTAQVTRTGLDKALLHLADNAVKHLRDGEPLRCTAEDAIRVHGVLENIGGK